MTEEKTKKEDILYQVKKVEKAVKLNLLYRRLADLKVLARDVLEAKEESVMILEEIGVSQEDIKRVIDFINSSPEVQLSEADKKELRERVRKENKQEKEEVQKEIEKHPLFSGSANFLGSSGLNTTSNLNYVDGGSTVITNNAGNSINLNL